MQIRKLRVAVATGTMVAGTIAVTWSDPDTVDGSSPVTIQLTRAPTFYWAQRTSAGGGAQGALRVTAVTANGCTVTSSEGTDTGAVRVYAIVSQDDL